MRDRVAWAVRDGGSNLAEMSSASNDNDLKLGVSDLHCFAHVTHLTADDSALKHCAASSANGKLRAAGKHFNQSAESHSALKQVREARNLDALQVKNDVATRWGRTHDAIERAVYITPAVTLLASGDNGARYCGQSLMMTGQLSATSRRRHFPYARLLRSQ